MLDSKPTLPSLTQSLSARLLVLTIAFVMLGEVMIYVPSISRFRMSWLEERLDAAHLATLALLEAPQHTVSKGLTDMLLADVGARAVVLKLPEQRFLMLSEEMPPAVDAVIDFRQSNPFRMVRGAVVTLLQSKVRVLRVIRDTPEAPNATIEVVIEDAALRSAMFDYSVRILSLSLIISFITAALVYASLQWLFVRPLRNLTERMVAFRRAPEDETLMMVPSDRSDEVGIAERELAEMQRELQTALRQKTHLAALGAAVSKVNHDLRNILATAQVVSDRLIASNDPQVRRVTPRLIDSIDRAINLCSRTLRFGRADEPPPKRAFFALSRLVDEVASTAGLPAEERIQWQNAVPVSLEVYADREQLFRVLLNLARNAVQAIPGSGQIVVAAEHYDHMTGITICDSGTGLPEQVQRHLFEPFSGAGRSGGTGLGLAIARDLMRAHGGDIVLAETGPNGTCFRLVLPMAETQPLNVR